MRLRHEEKDALEFALEGIPHEIYLFGTRVDDQKKGGDIDLLILVKGFASEMRYRLSMEVMTRFQSRCDEKIDVIVLDLEKLTSEEEAFMRSLTKQRLK